MTLILILLLAPRVDQAKPTVELLLQRLHDPVTTDAAAKEIRDIAPQDTQVREAISDALPSMIAVTQTNEVWLNAVELAGDLILLNIDTRSSRSVASRWALREPDAHLWDLIESSLAARK